jgi:hypothetical protein
VPPLVFLFVERDRPAGLPGFVTTVQQASDAQTDRAGPEVLFKVRPHIVNHLGFDLESQLAAKDLVPYDYSCRARGPVHPPLHDF